MKKIIALFLVLTLCLSSCKSNNNPGTAATSNTTEGVAVTTLSETTVISGDTSYDNSDTLVSSMVETAEQTSETTDYNESEEIPEFYSMDDPAFLEYVENSIYSELVADLDSADYFVENVQATYMPDEYYESLAFNSQENIYFGHTVSELNEVFQGKKYVFDLGDDGQTVVKEMEILEDNTEKEIIKNIAIGAGVILVCVTVSVVTGGAGAPAAVTAVFTFAAKGAAIAAVSSAAIGGVSAAVVKGYETRNFKEALKAGAYGASEEFKWGAIIGAITGGAGEAIGLKGAMRSGLKMSEAALIQKETKWPLSFIKNIHSVDEFRIYRSASLVPIKINGRWILSRPIDWNLVDSNGLTNIMRVKNHMNPIDATGRPFEVHHVGQKADGPFAILTWQEHHGKGNFDVLHYADEGKDVADSVFKEQKQELWEAMLKKDLGV